MMERRIDSRIDQRIDQRIEELVRRLGLRPHPEGGFYGESYRASESIAAEHLPARFGGARPFSTAIYYLLPSGSRSHLHRLQSDEVWHFYEGSPLTLHVLAPEKGYSPIHIGPNLSAGQAFQAVVPAGCWFGAELIEPDSYTLVGCTVAPGFDFVDFELAERDALVARFPEFRDLIDRLAIPSA